jgi:hypothetical protein
MSASSSKNISKPDGEMISRIRHGSSPAMPILREIGAPRAAYLARLEDELARGWGARGRRARSLHAAISLALDFTTWRALHERGLDRGEAVRLMTGLVRMSGSRQ